MRKKMSLFFLPANTVSPECLMKDGTISNIHSSYICAHPNGSGRMLLF